MNDSSYIRSEEKKFEGLEREIVHHPTEVSFYDTPLFYLLFVVGMIVIGSIVGAAVAFASI